MEGQRERTRGRTGPLAAPGYLSAFRCVWPYLRSIWLQPTCNLPEHQCRRSSGQKLEVGVRFADFSLVAKSSSSLRLQAQQPEAGRIPDWSKRSRFWA